MNSYELKQGMRKERLEQAAGNARQASTDAYTVAKTKASHIPFGQPILIGHHSENRDRNYRAAIGRGFEKASKLNDVADSLERRADAIGTGGISSDDPDAINKLKVKLAAAEAMQDKMKKANALIRKEDRPGLSKLGFTDEQILNLFKPFAGRIGFASFQLTNNNANIKRIKGRVLELEKKAIRADVVVEVGNYSYREDTEENRVMFIFEGKPDPEIRTILKRHAFKWSPTRNAWVRALTSAGIYAARLVRADLDTWFSA